MTCSVYRSRTSLLAMSLVLVLILAVWGYFVLPIAALPAVVRIGVGVFVAAALLACLAGMLAKGPVIQVDETGIAYHPKVFPKIDWADVVGVERAPLIEPTPDGLINHLKDGWRPVNIFVAGPDKYLRRLPSVLRQRLIVGEEDDAVRFQIEFMGLSPASAEVYDCIRRHLDARGVNA